MELDLIGKRIKLARESMGITQTDLASRIKKTESSVRKYESGLTEVPLSVLLTIAEALETTLPYLLSGYKEFSLNEEYREAIVKEQEKEEEFLFYRIEGLLKENGFITESLEDENSIIIGNDQKSASFSKDEIIKIFNEYLNGFFGNIENQMK